MRSRQHGLYGEEVSMKFVIQDENFYVNSKKHLFGTIYLDLGSVMFPCIGWTDFIEDILTMWTNDILNQNNKHYSHFTLPFIDGPYCLEVSKDNQMQLTIRCIDGRTSVYEIECSYYDFLSCISDGIQLFISVLQARQDALEFSGSLKCMEQFLIKISSIQEKEQDRRQR